MSHIILYFSKATHFWPVMVTYRMSQKRFILLLPFNTVCYYKTLAMIINTYGWSHINTYTHIHIQTYNIGCDG